MHERIWMRFPNFRSDNLKSKIETRKLMGIVALGIAFVLCGAVAAAQQPKKVFRIGYLSSLSPSSESARSEAIRLALREHGYIEGQNVTIESRYGAGKVDRATELAAELERLKVDIIVVTGGNNWIQAAKNATKTIPIVMVNSVWTPSRKVWLKALLVPAATSPALRSFPVN